VADANETIDWHIWANVAAVLIRKARKLHTEESLGVDLTNAVYALDASTIGFRLCPLRESSFVYLERYAVFQGRRDDIDRTYIKR